MLKMTVKAGKHTIPTINNFFLIFPLRRGVAMIFVWALTRIIICMLLIGYLIIKLHLRRQLEPRLFRRSKVIQHYDPGFDLNVFVAHNILFAAYTMIFVFTTFLGAGVFTNKPQHFKQYLRGRIPLGLVEFSAIVYLLVADPRQENYYYLLLFLPFIKLYGLLVIFGYYKDRLYTLAQEIVEPCAKVCSCGNKTEPCFDDETCAGSSIECSKQKPLSTETIFQNIYNMTGIPKLIAMYECWKCTRCLRDKQRIEEEKIRSVKVKDVKGKEKPEVIKLDCSLCKTRGPHNDYY